MSCASFPTANNASHVIPTIRSQPFQQFGQGLYIGNYMPGTNKTIASLYGQNVQQIPASGGALTLAIDNNFVSSLSGQPQNVLRITGAFGTSYIQGSNIAFALPYSGNAGVRILPSTNQINVNNIAFVSTINALNTGGTGLAGAINMTDLTSTIKGYGWARVSPASP